MRGSAAFRASIAPGGVLAGPWVRNELWRRARAVPSLDLRFADNKSLVDAVTGASLLTFTRASSATYVDSQGVIQTAVTNVPRFDHNPTTGESLGLLVEAAGTNLIADSSFPADRQVLGISTSTVASIPRPDGTTGNVKAFTVTNAAASPYPFFRCGFSTTANNVLHTGSIWIRAASGSHTLSFGISTASGPNQAASTTVTTTWTRLQHTRLPSNGNELFLDFYTLATANNTTFYIWGAQIEQGFYATSLIPTSGSTVTRAADVATVSNANSAAYPATNTPIQRPFGASAIGASSLAITAGNTVKRISVYPGTLSQTQVNAAAEKTDEFWRWRINATDGTFALPNFTTDGVVTVDWGDGSALTTLTTATKTLARGVGIYEVGFKLTSGTYFRPNLGGNAQALKIIALGPAPTSMSVNAYAMLYGATNLKAFDPIVNTALTTDFSFAWLNCTSLTSFPLINTAAGTDFTQAWSSCSSLTSFPAITFSSATNFSITWQNCTSLTSFPANMFNTTGTLVATAFTDAFLNCALTATSIENILTSLVTNGQSNITLTLSGGTNAGATTWTTAANTAYATLISRGWTITRNA